MTATYEAIATTTLGSAQASVTFSSISGTYTDLVLVMNTKLASGTEAGVFLQFNSDTNTNYSYTYVLGNGTSALSGKFNSVNRFGVGNVYSAEYSSNIAHIMNYANTTTNKTGIARQDNAANFPAALVAMWRSTSAITSIDIKNDQSGINFATGSTFTLYGIKSE